MYGVLKALMLLYAFYSSVYVVPAVLLKKSMNLDFEVLHYTAPLPKKRVCWW
jgi:hypothetical protein